MIQSINQSKNNGPNMKFVVLKLVSTGLVIAAVVVGHFRGIRPLFEFAYEFKSYFEKGPILQKCIAL